jgi:hypothetical protein
MATALQKVLRQGVATLLKKGGVRFTYSNQDFKAFPVQEPLVVAGRQEEAAQHFHWFEADATNAVAFTRGKVLSCEDGYNYTVAKREPIDATLFTFRFALHPGVLAT